MAIIEFSRTNQATQQVVNFKCCVSAQPDVEKTPKQLFDEEIGDWLLVEENGCKIMYIVRNVIERRSFPKKTQVFFDVESLVPDMTANTRNGRELDKSQTWNNTALIKYFEGFSMDGLGKAKRAINGVLEREFFCMPIFDPMNNQDAVVLESNMYPLVVAFQTHLASL